jgi:hypothetical protein
MRFGLSFFPSSLAGYVTAEYYALGLRLSNVLMSWATLGKDR